MCPSLSPRCSVSLGLAAGLAISTRGLDISKGFRCGYSTHLQAFSSVHVQSFVNSEPYCGPISRSHAQRYRFGSVDAFAINTPQPNFLLLGFHSADIHPCCKPPVGRCWVCVMKRGVHSNLHLAHRAA